MLTLPSAAFSLSIVAEGTGAPGYEMHQQRRVVAPKPERGVYWAVGTIDGKPSAFAIDSRGEEIARETLENDTWRHAEAVIEWLWRRLDACDPVPEKQRLQLVRAIDLPMTAQRPKPPIYDPYAEQGVPGPTRKPW